MSAQGDHSEHPGPAVEGPGASREVRWIARTVRPATLLQVPLVFLVFMAAAQFLFHSADAVRALALTTLAAFVALFPGVLGRVEYWATGHAVKKRPRRTSGDGKFTEVFRWEELDYVVRAKFGFRYFKRMDETSPLRRLWRMHLSDRYSGEIHVDPPDRELVFAMLQERGIPIR